MAPASGPATTAPWVIQIGQLDGTNFTSGANSPRRFDNHAVTGPVVNGAWRSMLVAYRAE